MKYLLFVVPFLANQATAQLANAPVKLAQYALDSFSTGLVQVKSGKTYQQRLNYNIVSGEMIFTEGGRLLAIAEPKQVDTIFFSNRKFVPLSDKFYEVLITGKTPLLLEYTSKVEEPGAAIGYGTTSTTTSSTSLKTLIQTGGINDLKLPDDFKVIPGFSYWVVKEGKWLRAGSVQQLTKAFPDKKDVIKDLAKKNNTDFTKKEDIIALVQQLQP